MAKWFSEHVLEWASSYCVYPLVSCIYRPARSHWWLLRNNCHSITVIINRFIYIYILSWRIWVFIFYFFSINNIPCYQDIYKVILFCPFFQNLAGVKIYSARNRKLEIKMHVCIWILPSSLLVLSPQMAAWWTAPMMFEFLRRCVWELPSHYLQRSHMGRGVLTRSTEFMR